MADAKRTLTIGEEALLRTIFRDKITYSKVVVHSERWSWPFPGDRAMAPNGEVYFPGHEYAADFSSAATALSKRATFVHEAAHLYQWYGLDRTVWLRGAFDRNYDYTLEPNKAYPDYGLEQMGSIAQDYYILREGGTHTRYVLADYAALLPLKP